MTLQFLHWLRALTESPYAPLLLGLLGALLGAYSVVVFRLFSRHPTTLTISLLGFPRSGKTVYLTALFDALQRESREGLRFVAYGRETIEEVNNNISLLEKGTWLPKTQPGSVFFYRASAIVGRGFVRSRYKVEIGDYAGEQMEEMNPSSSRWLHKTEYFKYVIQSDAVILALDTQMILSTDQGARGQMENAFVAAVQVLAEEKGATEDRRLLAPVALVFMKHDMAREKDQCDLEKYIPRLIQVCRSRCRNFRVFYVSSTGPLERPGTPPKHLDGEGVVEPLIWILGRQGRRPFPLTVTRAFFPQYTK
jgi:hypothetical protein